MKIVESATAARSERLTANAIMKQCGSSASFQYVPARTHREADEGRLLRSVSCPHDRRFRRRRMSCTTNELDRRGSRVWPAGPIGLGHDDEGDKWPNVVALRTH